MLDRKGQIGEILVSRGIISREQLEHAISERRFRGNALGEVLVELGYITRKDLFENLYEQTLDRILNVMRLMLDLELLLADFYQLCSQEFAQHAGFWLRLRDDEVHHAGYIGKIIQGMYERPQLFEVGGPCQPEAIERVVEFTKSSMERLRMGVLTHKDALNLSHTIEVTLVENQFFDMISTRDAETLELLRLLKQETMLHQKRIIENKPAR